MTRGLAAILGCGVAAAALAMWALREAPPVAQPVVGPATDEAVARERFDVPSRDANRIVARKFVESPEDAALPDQPEVDMVAISLEREDGRPIIGARLSLVPGMGATRSDDAGVVRVPARPDVVASYTLTPNEGPPLEGTVSLDPGETSIVVGDGNRIAGSVTVDGGAPKQPITVTLAGAGSTPFSASTDAAGRFEFFNLRAGTTASLEFPDYYLIVSDGSGTKPKRSQIEVRAPATIDVALTERSAIIGQVVSPKPNLRFKGFQAKVTRARDTGSMSVSCDADGRFALVVEPDTVLVVLYISDDQGLGRRDVEVRGPFAGVRDVGVIRLEAPHKLDLIVTDASGRPVQCARAAVIGTRSRSDFTDGYGRTTIGIDARPSRLQVGKIGIGTAIVIVSPLTSSPLEIRLQPGANLEIRIAGASQEGRDLSALTLIRPRGVHVRVDPPGSAFLDPSPGRDDWGGEDLAAYSNLPRVAGALPMASSSVTRWTTRVMFRGPSASMPFWPDADGKVTVPGLPIGTAVTIQLRGNSLSELLAEKTVVVDAGAMEPIEIGTGLIPKEFVGVVTTRSGKPVVDAIVVVFGPDGESTQAWTEGQGVFRVRSVFAATIGVEINAKGFAPLKREHVAVTGSDVPEPFVLIPY